jgi:hypothetical protein
MCFKVIIEASLVAVSLHKTIDIKSHAIAIVGNSRFDGALCENPPQSEVVLSESWDRYSDAGQRIASTESNKMLRFCFLGR